MFSQDLRTEKGHNLTEHWTYFLIKKTVYK